MTICNTCGAEGAISLRARLSRLDAPSDLLRDIPPGTNGPVECDACHEETVFLIGYVRRHPGSTEKRVAFALWRYRIRHPRNPEDVAREQSLTKAWLEEGEPK